MSLGTSKGKRTGGNTEQMEPLLPLLLPQLGPATVTWRVLYGQKPSKGTAVCEDLQFQERLWIRELSSKNLCGYPPPSTLSAHHIRALCHFLKPTHRVVYSGRKRSTQIYSDLLLPSKTSDCGYVFTDFKTICRTQLT